MPALYIGLLATVMSYLYLKVTPFYAYQIKKGAEAEESLWWHTVRHAYLFSKTKPMGRSLVYALGFGVLLSVSVLYKPWLPLASWWLNISLMALWLGVLALLARIDRLCFLLPDVLTQSLLWVGLMTAWLQPTPFLAQSLLAAATVYGVGRCINLLGFFFLKQPLFGHGDVKLVAAVAAWLGWEAILPLWFLACVCCVLLEALRQKKWRPQGACAFGPYLVLATLWVWLSGNVLWL